MGRVASKQDSIHRSARIVLLALSAIACNADDSGDSSASGTQDSTCSGAACGGSTSSDTTAASSSSDATTDTTLPPGESSTMPAESSSTGADACATDTCAACFECTYDDACQAEQSQCSVDPACSIAFICVRDCIQQSRDPAGCVAACDCPTDGPLPALLTCATAVCVPNGSCPALSC